MGKEKNIFFHEVCLISVFILGNLVIAFPKGYGSKYGLYGFLLCLALSFAGCFVYVYLQSGKFSENAFNHFSSNRVLNIVFISVFLIFLLVCYSVCTKDYIHMVDSVRLRRTPNYIIAALFILLSVWMGSGKKQSIYSFSMISFIFIGFAVLLMFLMSLGKFDWNLFKDAFDFDAKLTVRQAVSFYLHSYGQIIIALLFIGGKRKKAAKNLQLFGVSVSGLVFLLCLVNTVALIGVGIINRIDFPYATATGIINSSRDYTRLDIMTYFIFFVTSLIKSAVIYRVAISAAAAFSKTAKNITAAILPITAFLVSWRKNLSEFFVGDTLSIIMLVLEIIIPAAFMAAACIKNHSPA